MIKIIVTLPSGVMFYSVSSDGRRRQIDLADLDSEIAKPTTLIQISIPMAFNSMAIIDGQHRAYAFYEGDDRGDGQIINGLRKKLNLLVTGILYLPNGAYSDTFQQRKFESRLFSEINRNAKSVDSDTIIRITAIIDPSSPEALASKVILGLNSRSDSPFFEMFQISKTDPAPIKTASIVKYALSSLVVPENKPTSLFPYWLNKRGYKDSFSFTCAEDIDNYVRYCTSVLLEYFGAVREAFQSDWNNQAGKLKEVLCINAFLIAYRELLPLSNGPQCRKQYKDAFDNLNFSFSAKEDAPFPYAGSQYSKLAKEVISPILEAHVATKREGD